MLARRFCILVALLAAGVSSSVRADTLVLANGDEINGEITEWTVEYVVLEHPQLGTLRFALDELKLDTGKPPNPGLLGTRFLRGWARRIDVGISGERDESPSASVTIGTHLRYDDSWTRWKVNGRYFYNTSEDDDGDNDNNASLLVKRDWLTPGSRWFASVGSRYQFDQFQSWKHRITIFGGPGFHLIETERHSLDLLLGPAFSREFGTSDSNKAELVPILTYEWDISENQTLSLANQFLLELVPSAGDFRNFSTLDWTLRITEDPALSLSLKLLNEYESDPDPGDPHNDLKYFVTLGADF